VPDGGPPSDALDAPGAIFGPVVQIRMLEDRIRTSRFIEAIRRTVRPGDVVLDLGTGSGVFAVAAALAGARRVYAVESQPIAALADRFFRQAGLDDRIVLIRGVSTGIDLPEPADVLVSEIIGDDPLDEGIVAALADAGARMLKPDARRIPSALQICATPVEVPEEVRGRVILTPDLLRRWERRYRLPFRALAAPVARQGHEVALTRLQINPWIARHWPVLGPPVVLLSIDLAAPLPLPSETEAPLVFDREGPLGGFLIHFEADLAPGLRLSTDARTVERSNHWRSILWILPEAAKAGDRRPATLRAEHWRSAASAVFPG
jgi:protein arginine N-methyltransferase 1